MRQGVPTSNFSELHAAVHLAHKYQCPDVEARALSVLKRYYAPTFYTYNRYSVVASALATPPPSAAVAAINIARLTDTPSLLPFAFYLITTAAPSCIVDGYTRRDGSVEHLSAHDFEVCIGARSELAWTLSGFVSHVFASAPSVPGCAQKGGQCTTARRKIAATAEKRARGRCDALEPFQQSIAEWAEELKLCKVCKRDMLARDVEGRARVWMELLHVFRLTAVEVGVEFITWDGEDSDADSDHSSDFY